MDLITKTVALYRIAKIDEEIETLFDDVNKRKIKIISFIKTHVAMINHRVALVVALMSVLHDEGDSVESVKMTDEANLLYPSANEQGTAIRPGWEPTEVSLRRDRRDLKRDLLADPDNLDLQECLAETISMLEKIKQ